MLVESAESRSSGVMEERLHVGDVRGSVINAHTTREGGKAVHGEDMLKDWRPGSVGALAFFFLFQDDRRPFSLSG